MPVTDLSAQHIVKLLATETRRADTSPVDLADSHQQLGFFLAAQLVEHLSLTHRDITHPQGARAGWSVADESEIALVVFMRAGLYVAEGIRRVLRRAPVHHVKPVRGVGLDDGDLQPILDSAPHTVILIDSVVNTGTSLEPVLGQFAGKRLFVASLVAPATTALRLGAAWPNVHFLFARVSDNQYVGQGGTDTGNRLFGTFSTKNPE
jgi:uracil phosphoribosyltransferase